MEVEPISLEWKFILDRFNPAFAKMSQWEVEKDESAVIKD
jgi:hypothetical protein